MKRYFIVAVALLAVAGKALAFVPFGHQTISALADKYMTEKAKSEVKAILKSDMVEEANWLNSLRDKAETAHTKEWHFFTLDAKGKSTTTAENDGVVQLEKAIAVLRNRAAESDSLVNASLRSVIHLVGDMHCLSHIRIEGIEATKGFSYEVSNEAVGKAFKSWKASWYNLWERTFTNRYTIYTPQYYADDVDLFANDKKAEYEKGTPRFWVENGGEDVVRALQHFNTKELVPTQVVQIHEYNHTRCVAKAGYRLAALLNDIFK